MEKQITKVEESETFKMFKALQDKGFNVELNSMFSYSYKKDSSYLSISVYNANNKTTKLYNIASSFDIILVKSANIVHFEVRKANEFAELISESAWTNYYNSVN